MSQFSQPPSLQEEGEAIGLGYASPPAEGVRWVVKSLAHFTILYSVAVLLMSGLSGAQLLGFLALGGRSRSGFSSAGVLEVLFLGLTALEVAAVIGMIVGAAGLLGGGRARRVLVAACWAYIALTAAVVLTRTVYLFFTTFSSGRLPVGERLYFLGANVTGLVMKVVMPLMIASIFTGERGKRLVDER